MAHDMTPRRKRRVCLVAGSASKLGRAAAAEEIYTGAVFRASLAWARMQQFDDLAVLSARHHVVELAQEVPPGEESMHRMTPQERRGWAATVFAAIDDRWNLRGDDVDLVLLAGAPYSEELSLRIQVVAPRTRIIRPLAGLGAAQQKAWLRRATEQGIGACLASSV